MERKLHKNAKEMRSRVFAHMLKTRGWKYRAFLRYLRLFKYFAFAPVRGAFLESYYTLMRYLDDVVDGDVPLPDGYANESEYLLEKILFSKHPVAPRDEVDHLMVHCFELAQKFNENFQPETADILNSLLFDARRRGQMIIFSEEELMHHFHVLDVRGTIRATLKVFKEDPDKYILLEPLGIACRFQYDLEDLDTDIAAGYINISKEECHQLHITREDLDDLNSAGIRRWKIHRANEGLKLLERHHELLPQGKFSLLARATFPFVYEFPAKRVFNSTLKELDRSDVEEIKRKTIDS